METQFSEQEVWQFSELLRFSKMWESGMLPESCNKMSVSLTNVTGTTAPHKKICRLHKSTRTLVYGLSHQTTHRTSALTTFM